MKCRNTLCLKHNFKDDIKCDEFLPNDVKACKPRKKFNRLMSDWYKCVKKYNVWGFHAKFRERIREE